MITIWLTVREVRRRGQAVARAREQTYVKRTGVPEGPRMPAVAPTLALSWPVLLLSLLVGVMVAGTIGLWVYFGTTVFFEMVRSGIAACF